jgi:uncharacterized protein YdeI (YjbR/CyaY-like superfamily)
MKKTKHVPNASELIDEYFEAQPAWSKEICLELRSIILSSDPGMIEDWKWGPNFYCDGMVCGIGVFKKHVSLVFFQGTLINDKYKVFEAYKGTVHNRHIKYTNIGQINKDQLLDYLFQSIDNNRKGKKIIEAPNKALTIPADVKQELKLQGLVKAFENSTYSRRKELLLWVNDAKKAETRRNRIHKLVDHLKKKIK